jgi:hypothetical protein
MNTPYTSLPSLKYKTNQRERTIRIKTLHHTQVIHLSKDEFDYYHTRTATENDIKNLLKNN